MKHGNKTEAYIGAKPRKQQQKKKKEEKNQRKQNKMKTQQREPTETTGLLINLCNNYLVSTLGHPKKLDEDDLIQIINHMAMTGSAADSHRRTEVINSGKNLHDLTKEHLHSFREVNCLQGYSSSVGVVLYN